MLLRRLCVTVTFPSFFPLSLSLSPSPSPFHLDILVAIFSSPSLSSPSWSVPVRHVCSRDEASCSVAHTISLIAVIHSVHRLCSDFQCKCLPKTNPPQQRPSAHSGFDQKHQELR